MLADTLILSRHLLAVSAVLALPPTIPLAKPYQRLDLFHVSNTHYTMDILLRPHSITHLEILHTKVLKIGLLLWT